MYIYLPKINTSSLLESKKLKNHESGFKIDATKMGPTKVRGTTPGNSK